MADIPITDNIEKLRKRIADWKNGDDTKWVFSNEELQTFIDEGTAIHSNGLMAESELTTYDLSQVFMLAHALACETLATDNAKAFKYTEGLTGDNVDKTMTPEMFLKVATHLRTQYAKQRSTAKDETSSDTTTNEGGTIVNWASAAASAEGLYTRIIL